MAAVGTDPDGRREDALAVGADLDRRVALTGAGAFRLHRVDRPVPGDVAGEVEHQTVGLAGGKPGTRQAICT